MLILSTTDTYHCNDGIILIIASYLPYPIAIASRCIDQRVGISILITIGLVHLELVFSDNRQGISLHILKGGTDTYNSVTILGGIEVDDIEVHPVGLFIIGMTGSVGHIQFIFAIAVVFGIGACSCRLHYLVGSPCNLYVVILIRQGEACDGRMPTQSTPTEVEVLRVITHQER